MGRMRRIGPILPIPLIDAASHSSVTSTDFPTWSTKDLPMTWARVAVALWAFLLVSVTSAADPTLKLLFLGGRGHHRPADRAAQLIPVLAARGIAVTYTEDL